MMFASRHGAHSCVAVLLCAQFACGAADDDSGETGADVFQRDASLAPDVGATDERDTDAQLATDTSDITADARADVRPDVVSDAALDATDAVTTDVTDVSNDLSQDGGNADGISSGDVPEDVEHVSAPSFVRVAAGALAEHQVATENVTVRGFGYGYGIAPADPDGDGDLDLFVGTLPLSAIPACIYENVSTPGNIEFVRRERWCAPLEWELQSAVGLDADFDGEHELVAVSETAAYLFRERVGWTERGMIDEFERCDGGPIAAIDVDWDGDLEVVVGCLPDIRARSGIRQGTGFTLEINTERWVLEQADHDIFPLQENTIGLGVADANLDGLPDLISVVDTFGSPRSFSPEVEPSALLRRCGPDRGCGSERVRFGDRALAWGSHMGLEVVTMPDGRDAYWLADRDEPRPVHYGDEFFTPSPLTLPSEPFGDSEGYFDIWGIVAGAWNSDSIPDFFLATGRAAPQQDGVAVSSHDSILTSALDDRGMRAQLDAPASEQFEDPNAHRDPIHGSPRSSRAAIQQDIDQDGRAEIIVAASNGAPFVYVAEEGAEVCMVRPHAQTAATWGASFRILGASGVWATGPAHGEVLSNDGPWLITAEREGTLRFPSGAAVPYRCGPNTVIDVVEPSWLTHVLVGGALSVTVDERVWWNGEPTKVEAWVDSTDTAELIELEGAGGLWKSRALALEGPTRVLLRIDGQWVARWFELQ
jgi:hypothetical protein